MKKFLFAAALFLVSACQGDVGVDTVPETGDTGQLPASESRETYASKMSMKSGSSGTLIIGPENPFSDTVLRLSSRGIDLRSARIEWIVNRKPIAVPDPFSINLGDYNVFRGSSITARARIGENSLTSNTLTVVNSPPRVLTAGIFPERFGPGDMLRVEAEVSDIDGDDVSVEISWELNGDIVSTEAGIGRKIRRGDMVTVTVTPYDGEAYGDRKILSFGVDNAPPEIFPHNDFAFNGQTLSYEIWAGDEDDDPLTFSLTAGPPGMRVDPRTGIIRWDVPDEFSGTLTVSVLVVDGRGGEASYDLDISIAGEKEAPL